MEEARERVRKRLREEAEESQQHQSSSPQQITTGQSSTAPSGTQQQSGGAVGQPSTPAHAVTPGPNFILSAKDAAAMLKHGKKDDLKRVCDMLGIKCDEPCMVDDMKIAIIRFTGTATKAVCEPEKYVYDFEGVVPQDFQKPTAPGPRP